MHKKLLWINCGVAAITVAATMVSSGPPALPASIRAAYRAFCDPHLVDAAPPQRPAPALPQAACSAPLLAERPTPFESEIARALDSGGSDPAGPDPDDADLAKLTRPDLEIPITRRTMRYLRFYTRTAAGRHAFLARYRRAARYRGFIEDTLHDAGLPGDLVWLPAIESGYDVHAVSPVGAAGLWQFMPETGAAYGLVQSPLIDERNSVPQATRAAVKHLHDLHERFGRWDLALAAYNAGGGRVRSAMTRLVEQGGAPEGLKPPIAFASLASARLLPEETANYVPQVMAFALVAANVSELDLDVPDLPAEIDLGELSVPAGTHLETVARAAGIPLDLVRDYNPQLVADHVPPTGGNYLVALPADRVERARAAFPTCFDHEIIGHDEGDDSADPESEEPPAPAREEAPAARSERVLQRGPQKEHPRIEPSDEPVARAPTARPIPPIERPVAPVNSLPHLVETFKTITLANGILVRFRREPGALTAKLTVRTGTLDEGAASADSAPAVARGPRHGEGGASEAAQTIVVSRSYLAAGIELASTRLKLMLDESGSASLADVRRRAGTVRLRALEKAPYGAAWIALGKALFPPGHPLAGTVLGASQDPEARRLLLVADLLQSEHAFARASLTVVGDLDENVVAKLAEAALQSLAMPAELPLAPPSHQARLFVEESVRPPRMLLGWLAPAEGEKDDAPLRVLMEILENPRLGRLHKALIERDAVASTARASLELGLRAGVATIELAPAPGRDLAELERLLDAELAQLAAEGPSLTDLALAQSLLRAQVEAEIAADEALDWHPATATSLRRALQPTLTDSLLTRIDEVTVDSVKSMIARVFAVDHRVVVVAAPSARESNSRLAGR